MEILVVDDEKEICEVLEYQLHDLGYEVDIAYDPLEAIEELKKKDYRIIISDIRMPNGGGLALLKYVHEVCKPKPYFMFMTGHHEIPLRVLFEYGADCIFQKPFPMDKLEKITKNISAVDKSRWVNKAPRFKCEILISVKTNDKFKTYKIKNLSKTGFFIFMENNYPKEGMELDFTMNSISNVNKEITGKLICRWISDDESSEEKGIGVEILTIDGDGRSIYFDYYNNILCGSL